MRGRELVRELRRRELPQGGWSFGDSRQPSVEATTLAILALAAEFPEVPTHSVRFLLSVQRGDGSWPAFRGDDDGSWTTALAALTLSRVSVDSRVREKATAWLLDTKGREAHWLWRWKFKTADAQAGIGSCFRVYDDRDAEERFSFLEESYDPTEDAEALSALPDRSSILPPCMKARSLGPRRLRSLLSGMAPSDPAVRLLKAAVELQSVSHEVHLPPIPEHVRELFCDCNPPVPVLLAIYRLGDAIEASFDDERQSMLEATPEPWPLIPFNGTDPASTLQAFRCLGGALNTLAATRRVLDLVPGWEPITRDDERS